MASDEAQLFRYWLEEASSAIDEAIKIRNNAKAGSGVPSQVMELIGAKERLAEAIGRMSE